MKYLICLLNLSTVFSINYIYADPTYDIISWNETGVKLIHLNNYSYEKGFLGDGLYMTYKDTKNQEWLLKASSDGTNFACLYPEKYSMAKINGIKAVDDEAEKHYPEIAKEFKKKRAFFTTLSLSIVPLLPYQTLKNYLKNKGKITEVDANSIIKNAQYALEETSNKFRACDLIKQKEYMEDVNNLDNFLIDEDLHIYPIDFDILMPKFPEDEFNKFRKSVYNYVKPQDK